MVSDELIPDGPSDYSGLHPADALSLVSDARRLGLYAYIFASSGSATALVGVVTTRGILPVSGLVSVVVPSPNRAEPSSAFRRG